MPLFPLALICNRSNIGKHVGGGSGELRQTRVSAFCKGSSYSQLSTSLPRVAWAWCGQLFPSSVHKPEIQI